MCFASLLSCAPWAVAAHLRFSPLKALSSDSLAQPLSPDSLLSFSYTALLEKVVGAERRAEALLALAQARFALQQPSYARALWSEAVQETERLTNPEARSAQLAHILQVGLALNAKDTVPLLAARLSNEIDRVTVQLALCNAYLNAGETQPAQQLAKVLYDAIPALENDARKLTLWGQLALVYFKLGDNKSGQNELKEVLLLANRLSDDLDAAVALGKLSVELLKAKQQTEGQKVWQGALTSIGRIKDKSSAMAVREALAELLIEAGEFATARTLANAIADVPERLKVLSNLARKLSQSRRSSDARQVADQMYQLLRTLRNTSNRAEAIGKVAQALAEAGFTSDAQTRADEALAAINAIPVDFDKSAVAAELAASFAESGLFDKAEQALQRVKVPVHRAAATADVGLVLLNASQTDKALPLLLEALSLQVHRSNPEVKVRTLSAIALALHKAKSEKADSAFQACIAAVPDITAQTKRAEACIQIATAWTKAGAIKYALDILRQMPDAAGVVVGISDIATVCYETRQSLSGDVVKQLKALQDSLP